MTKDQKRALQQLWNIADTLRGKLNADEFRDYCLGACPRIEVVARGS